MTGREAIFLILENRLEDDELLDDTEIKVLIPVEKAAEKYGVGVETMRVYWVLNKVDGLVINDKLYIYGSLNLLESIRIEVSKE